MKKIPPLIAEAIIRAAKKTATICVELNLRCYDPPTVISPLLRCLGYNEYQIRRFWHYFEENQELKVEIYKYLEARFFIISTYRKEAIAHVRDSCIPLDELDCRKLGSDCIKTPHTHALYFYIDGKIGNAEIRVNVIRLLSLLYAIDKETVDRLLNTLIDIVWNRVDTSKFYKHVLEALHLGDTILGVALPLVPNNIDKLLQLSPILRKIYRIRK